jgi:hypothetical protein
MFHMIELGGSLGICPGSSSQRERHGNVLFVKLCVPPMIIDMSVSLKHPRELPALSLTYQTNGPLSCLIVVVDDHSIYDLP